MPVRARALAAILSLVTSAVLGAVPGTAPAPVAAGMATKVAIIVGPVGSLTASYRSGADRVATAAAGAGATVVKVYSPNATWANVKAAVNGANVIVYYGHGNGYPNPYSAGENIDRVNGWGLNRTTNGGDADNWSTTMAYCGEKVLLGQLTSSDDSVRQTYCGGTANDGITPAPGFVMVYAQAHYTPGFGERYDESDPLTTQADAQAHVRHYSYPVLRLGAAAYFATAYGDADDIVRRVLTQPSTTFGDIFKAGEGYAAGALKTMTHPDMSGAQVWVQRTVNGSLHFGDPDYWYAFAGNPALTPSGQTGPRITLFRPSVNATNAVLDPIVSATFDQAVTGVSATSFYLRRIPDLTRLGATVSYNAYWKRAEMRPSASLTPGTTYIATITGDIASAATGAPTVATSWRFTTSQAPGDPGVDQVFSPPVRVTFRQGTHSGYRFDAAGHVVAVKTGTLAADSGATTDERATLPNQSGHWFSIVNGGWAGYWIRESSAVSIGTAATATATSATTYNPTRRLAIRHGTHTGYRFDSHGRLTAQRTYTLGTDSGANTSVRGSIANQYGTWFYVANGVWAGFWVRESDVITLVEGG